MARLQVPDLGAYLREQREAAELSLRQLSELAGVSNPYLSQIERGLRRPSAEILNALAKGLQISAESLYVRAGLLDEVPEDEAAPDAPAAHTCPGVVEAIGTDAALTPRQRATLIDLYQQLVAQPEGRDDARPARGPREHAVTAPASAPTRRRGSRRTTSTTTSRSTT